MKSDEIPCFICTTSIPSSSRRYGGRCCKSCAAFFARSITKEKDYKCKASNDCLISPSVLGKGCRRCRFDKCIEIGMSTNGMQPQSSAAPVAPAAPTQATPIAPQSAPLAPQAKETVKEKAVIFAKIIDTILANSIQFPNMITEYLGDNQNKT
uniref:Nuclear receptor domain-containing protein n=1 Tax=Panagrolaimus sp. PS1159 TaxID=55785 RepID=A0AC35GKS8_9BILA